jgi:oligopeptide transport system permease protein
VSASGWIGAALLAALLGLAVLGDAATGYHFDAQDAEARLLGPSAAHWLGTDPLGRDVAARLAEGARVSLVVAVASTLLAVALGMAYGGAAGWAGGRVDAWLMRGLDVAYALPDLLLIVLFTQVGEALLADVPDLWRRLLALVAALALVSWVSVARLVRGLVLAAREEPWVEAARASGARPTRVLLRHVLPNLAGPLLVMAALRIPAAILAESTVSFLGLGIQPPFASWGVLAADGFEGLRSYPHLILAPSAALAVTLAAFHLAGEALRGALDPRERTRLRG